MVNGRSRAGRAALPVARTVSIEASRTVGSPDGLLRDIRETGPAQALRRHNDYLQW